MFYHDLFQRVLIKPAEDGASELLIVSGYATASMADRHLRRLETFNSKLSVKLIYGMAYVDGVSSTDDSMFRKLESEYLFSCFYYAEPYPVHSKVYVWLADKEPYKAYIGSANYTQGGFVETGYREVMAEVNPHRAFKYYNKILCGSLEISHDDVHDRISIPDPTNKSVQGSINSVELPLFSIRDGIVPKRSGLNWGQRPEEGRNPNQSYIPVPAPIRGSGFFPPKAVRFTILTDDGVSFIGTVAQDDDKAIHSTEDNTIIGRYFRDRLGVDSGAMVNMEDLDRYGRRDVTFWKIDDETFYMDFSVD